MHSILARARYWTPERARSPVLRVLDRNRDLQREARQRAFVDSAQFVHTHMADAIALTSPFAVLDYALRVAPVSGIVAEFGVFRGRTLRRIERSRPNCHGFDSFEGLPQDWVSHWTQGSFALDRPPRVKSAQLHVGLFEESLPEFLAENQGPAAFLHLDADLYDSTISVLTHFENRLVPGSILLFDEYFNFAGWQEHEHRALNDFAKSAGRRFKYVAYNRRGQQVAVRITE